MVTAPYWASPSVTLYRASADTLPLADSSVDLCVTSPPYYGLRSYVGLEPIAWVDGWTGHLGAEPTVESYIAHLVQCFREVRRVLKPWGSLWLNLGDSYATSPPGNKPFTPSPTSKLKNTATDLEGRRLSALGSRIPKGFKPGDLMGIPWRVALALQADGWHLVSDVIWHKPSVMPESVNGWRFEQHKVKVQRGRVSRHGIERGNGHVDESDVINRSDGAEWADCPGCAQCAPNGGLVLRKARWRPTGAHEYIFQFSKGPTPYGDRTAVAGARREAIESTHEAMQALRANVASRDVLIPQDRERRVSQLVPPLCSSGNEGMESDGTGAVVGTSSQQTLQGERAWSGPKNIVPSVRKGQRGSAAIQAIPEGQGTRGKATAIPKPPRGQSEISPQPSWSVEGTDEYSQAASISEADLDSGLGDTGRGWAESLGIHYLAFHIGLR